jgi:hypothetical protein
MGFEGGIRSRKDALVPMDEEAFKIEIVDVGSIEEYQMLSLGAHQIVEVVTSSPTQSLLEGTRPRKRAKLDHLSPDQKTQHRKMMNRMSAQSARDRQRAQMVLQEQALKEQLALVRHPCIHTYILCPLSCVRSVSLILKLTFTPFHSIWRRR